MKKTLKWGLSAAAVAVIIAAVVAVVLVLVLKKEGDDSGLSERVTYFAMHLGDVEASFKTKDGNYKSQKCSFDVNVDSTRSSINEAIAKLDSIKPKTQESSFSQETVVKEFERRSGEHDLLVYYIPCSFDYSHDDEDVKKFVEEVKKAGLEKRILAISNTLPAKQVSDLYQLDNVAGSDTTDIARKISEFAKPKAFNCLIVGDIFNYGTDQDAYEMEADLIADVTHDLFTAFLQLAFGPMDTQNSQDLQIQRLRG
ncbi:hypothetical protein Aduo_006815 [Ancylostoma duodenale]